MGLWKTVENVERLGNAVRACSGCAGEYEDPDRTAWEAGEEDEAETNEVDVWKDAGKKFRDGGREQE